MTEKQIRKRIYLWKELLGMRNYELLIFFEKLNQSKMRNNYMRAARTDRVATYMSGAITIDPRMRHTIDDETIVHELLHMIISEMSEYAHTNLTKEKQKLDLWYEHFEEKFVSELARIIISVKNNNQKIEDLIQKGLFLRFEAK